MRGRSASPSPALDSCPSARLLAGPKLRGARLPDLAKLHLAAGTREKILVAWLWCFGPLRAQRPVTQPSRVSPCLLPAFSHWRCPASQGGQGSVLCRFLAALTRATKWPRGSVIATKRSCSGTPKRRLPVRGCALRCTQWPSPLPRLTWFRRPAPAAMHVPRRGEPAASVALRPFRCGLCCQDDA